MELSEFISFYESGSLKNTYLMLESSEAGKEQSFSISTDLYDYIERTAEKHGGGIKWLIKLRFLKSW